MIINGGISRFDFKNLIYRAFIVLLVMVFCSFWMVCDIFARYVSASQNSDTSRIASFKVQAYSNDENANIALNNSLETRNYSIIVENQAEVDVKYKVVLLFDKELPNGVTIKVDEALPTSASTDRKEFDFEDVGVLNIGESKECILTFEINRDEFTKNESGIELLKEIDFHINVHFEQVN